MVQLRAWTARHFKHAGKMHADATPASFCFCKIVLPRSRNFAFGFQGSSRLGSMPTVHLKTAVAALAAAAPQRGDIEESAPLCRALRRLLAAAIDVPDTSGSASSSVLAAAVAEQFASALSPAQHGSAGGRLPLQIPFPVSS